MTEETRDAVGDLHLQLVLLGWQVRGTVAIPSREERRFPLDDLALSAAARKYLSGSFPDGIYLHQKEAIRLYLDGRNVCLTTSTASGKSAAFYAAGIEELSRDQEARVFALYPLKALATEQTERWQAAVDRAGLDVEVGQLFGGVSKEEGWRVLRDCRVVALTPDILHARVLPNAGRRDVKTALRNLRLVILDEVHGYTGVFGSNSAFLFRRIRHLLRLLGGSCRFMAASATIRNALEHLGQLVGLPFVEVGEDLETSPRGGVDLFLLDPPGRKDLLRETAELVQHFIKESQRRLIVFMESRKQTEQMATILGRGAESDSGDEDDGASGGWDGLFGRDALPYRAGYEEHDRRAILARLRDGSLRCVVSTSALELGIDVPHLDSGILLGVPGSSTSLKQRIGRVGRRRRGEVLVINRGTGADLAVFNDPKSILDRPPAEGALYLQNRRIQYIHALCLARAGGEHDVVAGNYDGPDDVTFDSSINWPEGFLDLCRSDRIGEIDQELQSMKVEAGEDPNHVFPLRDVEMQFKVEDPRSPDRDKGSLSFGQVLREAYPGAVYRYVTQPFRVVNVYTNKRIVKVRREKSYFTTPTQLPVQVFPNLTEGSVYQAFSRGESLFIECSLQIRQSVSGYTESRGQNKLVNNYPLSLPAAGLFFPLSRFTRNFFTSGVLVAASHLDGITIDWEAASELLFEAFLGVAPFERRDISIATGKFRVERGPVRPGRRFLALYDETYGSLRLSARLLEEDYWRQTLVRAHAMLEAAGGTADPATAALVDALLRDAETERVAESAFATGESAQTPEGLVSVIAPGSFGLDLRRNNEEFFVQRVFFSPSLQSLAYFGYAGRPRVEMTIPVDLIVPVPGESQMVSYNVDTGEVTASA